MRDYKLDFVKGFLVFAMVIYHSMNYFTDAPPEVYGYLRFVNGAFVFISGYIISAFYAPGVGRGFPETASRLIVRSLKLLIIFTALNLTISALALTSYKSVEFGLSGFFSNLAGIYLRGDSDAMAFRILLPISYVLMMAPLVLSLQCRTSTLALVLITLTLGYTWLGIHWPNLYFVLVGLAGLIAGRGFAFNDLVTIQNRTIALSTLIILALAMNVLSGNAATYAIGIFLTLKVVYDQAATLDVRGQLMHWIVMVGQYSLVAYISQIAFINLVHLLIRDRLDAGAFVFAVIVISTSALMLLIPVVIGRFRSRYPMINGLYRLMLG